MDLTLSSESPWQNWQKILFRFFFIYFALYISAVPLWFIHDLIIPWIGKNIMGIEYEIGTHNTGSGDTTFSYVQLAVFSVLTIIGTAIWSILDRNRINYSRLFYFFRAGLRYYLGLFMLLYGFAKLFGGQFGPPSLSRLLEPLGEFSPMGLAWTFMGYSKAYSAFAGMGEIVGGLLLFYRKTTTLGAIAVIAVMANVVMMNFSYDIPVKLFSSHLLLISVFLLANDYQRFLHFFVLNRPFNAINYPPHFLHKNWELIRKVIKGIGALAILGGVIALSVLLPKSEKPPLYGIYEVETFIQNGDTLAPITTDPDRWNKIIIEQPRGITIKLMNDDSRYYTCKVDTSHQHFNFQIGKDTTENYKVAYFQPEPDVLVLAGQLKADTLNIRMKRFDEKEFRLIKRGFHWINEVPYNR